MTDHEGAVLYENPRLFTVHTWGQGHTGLVLRSNPNDEHESRIEILFKPAYAVFLVDHFRGLRISVANHAEVPEGLRTINRFEITQGHVLQLHTTDAVGYVIAGGVHGREDHEDYTGAPMFDGRAPRPGVSQLFSWWPAFDERNHGAR